MGTFLDPQHAHLAIQYWSPPPPPPGNDTTNPILLSQDESCSSGHPARASDWLFGLLECQQNVCQTELKVEIYSKKVNDCTRTRENNIYGFMQEMHLGVLDGTRRM